jgi:hypothetical protein
MPGTTNLQEKTMRHRNALLTLTSMAVIGGAALVGAAPSSWAQTATESTSSSVDSSSSADSMSTSLAIGARKPTSATPRMIDEAIQRSQARSANQRIEGKPEQWGSEEPFTYVPGRTAF